MPYSSRTNLEVPPGLQISAYDRVSGTIIALLLIVGFGVAVLALLWLADRAISAHEIPPVELIEESPAGGTHARGTQQQLIEPGVEEFADVSKPQLTDTLAAITTAVTTQQAVLDELQGDAEMIGTGEGSGDRAATGSGGGGNQNVIPRWERFKLRLAVDNARNHARVLNFFRIELGVLGGGIDGIVYVANLSAAKPATRTGYGDQEQRLYFPQDSSLAELDAQLLAKAGVERGGREIVYFIPPDVENQLAHLERDFARGRSLEEIQRTVFGVRSIGEGYELYVIDQDYRPPS